ASYLHLAAPLEGAAAPDLSAGDLSDSGFDSGVDPDDAPLPLAGLASVAAPFSEVGLASASPTVGASPSGFATTASGSPLNSPARTFLMKARVSLLARSSSVPNSPRMVWWLRVAIMRLARATLASESL